ncbi:MAG: SpoIIE family protein phosphatase [Coriobacteriia bacterium]
MHGDDLQALLQSGQVDTILATIPAGVIITDVFGRIVKANEQAGEIWGGAPPRVDDIAGYTQFRGWCPLSGAALQPQDWAPVRALLHGEVVRAEVVDIERFDGRRATIVNSAAPLRDRRGHIRGAFAVMQDVTEQRERQRTNELLLEALRALAGSLDLSEVLERLVHVLLETGAHTRASVMMWHEDDEALELAAVEGEPGARVGARVPISKVSRSMREAVHRKTRVLAEPPESSLIVPLVRGDRLLGVVTVDEMRRGVGFTEREVTLVEGLASSAALAIENARLYEAEHMIAFTLQQALIALPESLRDLAFAHAYRSASEAAFVGGDFYDLFEIEGDLVGVLIGDIAGKGLDAALLTQLVKNTVRAHAAEKGGSPARILQLTNNIFYQVTSPDMFVTVFFGVLDRLTGRLVYTNAGHTTALVLRGGRRPLELPADSPLVGAFADREFVQSEVWLDRLDLLVLYTDGITEARSAGRLYGEERLLRRVSGASRATPAELVREILSDVRDFSAGSLNDDLAVLVLQRCAEEAESPIRQQLEVALA